MQKENFVIAARFTESGIVDDAKKTWVNKSARTVANDGKFGGASFNIRAGYTGFECTDTLPCNWSETDEWTISFWVKRTATGGYWEVVVGNTKTGTADSVMAANDGVLGKPALRINGSRSYIVSNEELNINKWQHVAFTCKDKRMYCFVDGVLQKNVPSKAWNMSQIALGSWETHHEASGQYYVDDVCILNKCLWVADFTPPDTYLYNVATKALLVAKTPVNLLDKTSVSGFTIAGIQPANTNRRVAFKVDDKWNKLTTDGALSPLTTQAITSDSVLSEGNTVEELTALTNVPSLVGKLVYPAIALYASEKAEVMPTFGMTVNATTDQNKNSITSPVYHISDAEITIMGITVNKKIVGNAGINIVASIKNSSGWSYYTDIDNIISKKATDIKFIYTFYVKECNGENSARLIDIAVNYDQDNPVMTLTGTFKISPLILCINEKENGLTHYKFDYVKEAADTTNGKIPRRCFARKLYKVSSDSNPVDKKMVIDPGFSKKD